MGNKAALVVAESFQLCRVVLSRTRLRHHAFSHHRVMPRLRHHLGPNVRHPAVNSWTSSCDREVPSQTLCWPVAGLITGPETTQKEGSYILLQRPKAWVIPASMFYRIPVLIWPFAAILMSGPDYHRSPTVAIQFPGVCYILERSWPGGPH